MFVANEPPQNRSPPPTARTRKSTSSTAVLLVCGLVNVASPLRRCQVHRADAPMIGLLPSPPAGPLVPRTRADPQGLTSSAVTGPKMPVSSVGVATTVDHRASSAERAAVAEARRLGLDSSMVRRGRRRGRVLTVAVELTLGQLSEGEVADDHAGERCEVADG